jgi:hypothetical protein
VLMTSHIYNKNTALSTATEVTMVPMIENWWDGHHPVLKHY